MYMYACMYVCINTYIHKYIHTYIPTKYIFINTTQLSDPVISINIKYIYSKIYLNINITCFIESLITYLN